MINNRKKHKQIVPLEVEGIPGNSDVEHQVAENPSHNGKPKNNSIHVFIRTYDGL